MLPATRSSLPRLLLGLLAGAAMHAAPTEIFLNLPDVPGEVRGLGHLHWIGVTSFDHAIDGIAPVWDGGGTGVGHATHGTLFLRKRLDTSSPKLALLCGQGARKPSATLEFTRTVADEVRFYRVELTEVAVTHLAWSPGGSQNAAPNEEVGLSYKGIEWIYTPLDANGTPSDDLFAWWNVLGGFGGDAAVECITAEPSLIQASAGHQPELTVTIPPLLNVGGTVGVRLTSSDPTVVTFPGASNGQVLLAFPADTLPVKTVKLLLLRAGQATITLTRSGDCVANAVTVVARGSLIRNPSFEASYPAEWPHYGAIDDWSGGVTGGVNRASDPFQDNGSVPDREQVAFMQGSLSLSQDLSGLDPARSYWLQFRYNARNCCGGKIGLSVSFAGQEIAAFPSVAPVGGSNPYAFAHVAFQPSSAAGRLEFRTVAQGDATLLIDAVNLVQRDPGEIVIRNPSFQASGIPATPGYLQPQPLEGWIGAGSYGVNGSGLGPFADNGQTTDQDAVAFLQNPGSSLRQTVEGLTPGTAYTLTFGANARSGNAPRLRVTLDNEILLEQDFAPVGGAEPYTVAQVVFVATRKQGVLMFEQTAPGDHSILLDDIRLVPGVPPGWLPALSMSLTPQHIVRVGWPRAYAGFRLQSATSVDGPWSDWPAQPHSEPADFSVEVAPSNAVRYFRLYR